VRLGIEDKEAGLRGFSGALGFVCRGAFMGEAVAVKARFRKQAESLHRETELVLGDGEAFVDAAHGGKREGGYW
jgi:hypothetical protein